MALTIEQLQSLIDAKPDLRELINQLADYLQANPPGLGGSQNLDQVLSAGATLTDNREIDLGGNQIQFENGLTITDNLVIRQGFALRVTSPDNTEYNVTMANGGIWAITPV